MGVQPGGITMANILIWTSCTLFLRVSTLTKQTNRQTNKQTYKQTNIDEPLQKLFQHILYGSNDVDIQKHSAYYGKAKTEDLCHT